MHGLVYLPLLISACLGLAGRRLGRWLPPATAVRTLAVAALVTALATGFSLTVLGFALLAQLPPLAALGHWSVTVLRAADPVPTLAGSAAAATAVVLLLAATHRSLRSGRDFWAAAHTCRQLGGEGGGLVVVDDPHADAFALPGVRGRIVVSTAMLRALPAPERRALLAHEAAHLRHHHHLYLVLADLGATANPLLRPLAAAVRQGVERWADEEAAAEVGDRRVTARALARAGLARSTTAAYARAWRQPRGAALALAQADGAVADRARALLASPPAPRRLLAGTVVAVVVAGALASVAAGHETERIVERAQATYSAGR